MGFLVRYGWDISKIGRKQREGNKGKEGILTARRFAVVLQSSLTHLGKDEISLILERGLVSGYSQSSTWSKREFIGYLQQWYDIMTQIFNNPCKLNYNKLVLE